MPEATNGGDAAVEKAKVETAELLGLPREDLDYITHELLGMEAQDVATLDSSGFGDPIDEPTAELSGLVPVPNRISYISEIRGGYDGRRHNITYFQNCDRRTRYLMWDDQYTKWERSGTCGVGDGRYVYRFKLWWRA